MIHGIAKSRAQLKRLSMCTPGTNLSPPSPRVPLSICDRPDHLGHRCAPHPWTGSSGAAPIGVAYGELLSEQAVQLRTPDSHCLPWRDVGLGGDGEGAALTSPWEALRPTLAV